VASGLIIGMSQKEPARWRSGLSDSQNGWRLKVTTLTGT
jgi:hypothetical protein